MVSRIRLGNKSDASRVLWGWALAALITLLACATFSFLVAYGYSQMALASLSALLGCALYAFWRIQDWDAAKFDGFGPALLLFMIVFKVLGAFDFLIFGIRTESWPSMLPMEPSYEWLVFKGELLTQLGVLLMAGVWRVLMGSDAGNSGFMDKAFSIPTSTLLFLYMLALATRVSGKLLGADFGVLGSLIGILFEFGVAAVYLLGASQRNGLMKVLVSAGLGLPMLLLALSSGVKEELIVPLIPAGLHLIRLYRSTFYKLAIAVIALLILAMAQSFVSVVRETAWANEEDVALSELSSIYIEKLSPEYVLDSVDHVFSRVNMANMHAVTVAVQQSNGFYFNEIIGGIPATFIPRIVWPGKPATMPGAQHTKRIWGVFADNADITTATSAGFFTELYLGGGIVVMVFGTMAFALLLVWLYRYLNNGRHVMAAYLFSYTYFIAALRFDELHVVYAFNGVVLFFLVVYAMDYLAKFYENSIKRT